MIDTDLPSANLTPGNDPRGYDEQTGLDQEKLRWLAARKTEAVKIDPATAKVMWRYGQIVDPYGVHHDDLSPEEDCVGRLYFARSSEPDSIWVCFYDLPAATRDALWTGIEAGDDVVWEPEDELPF